MKITAVNPWGEKREYSHTLGFVSTPKGGDTIELREEISEHILSNIELRVSDAEGVTEPSKLEDIQDDINYMFESLKASNGSFESLLKIAMNYGYTEITISK